ncbi:MraY family glycosyltransferase [Coraliomargarita parva]|uniref:MraY family glycosyltransferase n=1 Tax=Coraliomargarita parva TaxID=3014050 RepID=UPI0022B39D83|nr:MraY family glycosyltransferase [Coraliomargarita parva]
MFFPVLFFLLLGCFVSWLSIFLLLHAGLGQTSSTTIQHHHTHTGVIPRIGGAGIVLGFTVTYLLCFFNLDDQDNASLMHYGVFAGAAGAFLLGFLDDMKPMGAKVKLLAQIIIALLAHECGLSVEKFKVPFFEVTFDLGFFSIFLTVAWFVAMMNLINLIDGLDGLAGGIGLMLMALLAYLGYEGGVVISTILALGMVGAILGFLFHNFPPAKVYMGDSGAYLIGYVIAALSLMNSHKGTVIAALIAPVLALALPIVDVGFAILRRGIRGLPLFRPDRLHIHHRLLGTGLSHRNTVLVLYAVSLFALVGGLLAFANQGRYLPIFLGFAFVVLLITLRGQKFTADALRNVVNDSIQARQDTRNALHLKDWFIVESERADSGQHLWSDYRFILKKMGFIRAELQLGEKARNFYVPNTAHDQPEELWQYVHTLRGEYPGQLVLYAEKNFFSERQFAILADIATEAWGKAAARWEVVNDGPLHFEAKAKAAESYRAQKARSLYRPTY